MKTPNRFVETKSLRIARTQSINASETPLFPVSSLYRRARSIANANKESSKWTMRPSDKPEKDTEGKISATRKPFFTPVPVPTAAKILAEELTTKIDISSTAHFLQKSRRKKSTLERTRSRSASPKLDVAGAGAPASCPNSLAPYSLSRHTRSRYI